MEAVLANDNLALCRSATDMRAAISGENADRAGPEPQSARARSDAQTVMDILLFTGRIR
jgi:hypothetical protein